VAIVENCGHWVQQEYPERVSDEIITFLQHEGPR
jgi:pimeloyl-ACP methyl ester carboxylesterase